MGLSSGFGVPGRRGPPSHAPGEPAPCSPRGKGPQPEKNAGLAGDPASSRSPGAAAGTGCVPGGGPGTGQGCKLCARATGEEGVRPGRDQSRGPGLSARTRTAEGQGRSGPHPCASSQRPGGPSRSPAGTGSLTHPPRARVKPRPPCPPPRGVARPVRGPAGGGVHTGRKPQVRALRPPLLEQDACSLALAHIFLKAFIASFGPCCGGRFPDT